MSYGNGRNAPFGLQPRRLLSGALWNGQMNEYYIASGYATSLFDGDPVYVAANGTIVIAGAGTGNPITGVFKGCKFTSTVQGVNGNQIFSPYWPGGTVTFQAANAIALVCDDPDLIYDVQVYSAANPPVGAAAVDLYNNANLIAAAGSTLSGLSGWNLDQTSIAVDATRQLKILRFVPIPGNGPGLGFNNVEVVINNNYYKGGTGTVGV